MTDQVRLVFKSGTILDVQVTRLQGRNISSVFRAYLSDPANNPVLFQQVENGDISVPCAELAGVLWEQA